MLPVPLSEAEDAPNQDSPHSLSSSHRGLGTPKTSFNADLEALFAENDRLTSDNKRLAAENKRLSEQCAFHLNPSTLLPHPPVTVMQVFLNALSVLL